VIFTNDPSAPGKLHYTDTWRRECKYDLRTPATVSVSCPKMSLQILPLQARREKQIVYWKTLRIKVLYTIVENTFFPIKQDT
jgi:hypothetical protein